MGRAILVVDDNLNIVKFLVDLLTFNGFAVRSAMNGREALYVVSVWQPDLILLDLLMPVMDGIAFLTRRQTDPALKQIPVIVITADWTLGSQPPPADAVMAKPFGIAHLLQQIETLIPAGTD